MQSQAWAIFLGVTAFRLDLFELFVGFLTVAFFAGVTLLLTIFLITVVLVVLLTVFSKTDTLVLWEGLAAIFLGVTDFIFDLIELFPGFLIVAFFAGVTLVFLAGHVFSSLGM